MTAVDSVQQQVCCSRFQKSLACITAGSQNVLPVMTYWTARGKLDQHSLHAEIDQTVTLSVMPAVAWVDIGNLPLYARFAGTMHGDCQL